MKRNNFGKGKHRIAGSLWESDKDGSHYLWKNGKFVKFTKAEEEDLKALDELLKEIDLT